MSEVLSGPQRTALDGAVQRGRAVAEAAAADELRRLAVADRARPGYLSEDENGLRLALREKARQLGDDTRADDADLTLLTADVAYEQWHRLLFARFLEVNGLLLHPAHGVPVTMAQCEDLAAEEGEPDGWSVAAAFAAAILPGVFRLNDPSVRVRFSPERRAQLEAAVAGIDRATFASEDGLGWVYQFWQTAQKKLVNESGRKIGGADLSPVTQLFTENYMVRFLLENSLGAWWAARHPDSPLVATWDFLRTLEDGTPAAGTFDEWPATAAEVTVMDPCCGSGHFLVAAFGMLWRMRAEEEGLDAAEAQDAVLRDNLFGLELDPRCTQIAMFNVVLEAWKQGGHRPLPTPQIACSGIPVRASRAEWEALAGDDGELRAAMGRLHTLFRNADTLGSLIDPRPRGGDGALLGSDLRMVDTWERTSELLGEALADEGLVETVTGDAALGVAHAAHLLGRPYTLVTTNPPYLLRASMDAGLQQYVDVHHPLARMDLATVFIERALAFVGAGSIAVVSPQNWLLLKTYRDFRVALLDDRCLDVVARLGSGAFRGISGEVVKVSLTILTARAPTSDQAISGLLAHRVRGVAEKAAALREATLSRVLQTSQRANPDSRVTLTVLSSGTLLAARATGLQGIATADYPRFGRAFWERPLPHPDWELQQSTVPRAIPHGGREHIVWWERGKGALHSTDGVYIRGERAWGERGVAVSQMGDLPVTLYTGELFDNNTAVILPHDDRDLPAIWAYCSSPEFAEDVRELDDALKVTNATLVKVAFDRERWRAVADAAGPLPEPHSDDPTQWLFRGTIPNATEPLQVAVARLLGYRWPDQVPDHLDELADADGIIALPALLGEQEAATRLRAVLARAYGAEWSTDLERQLVVAAGGASGVLADWLRDTFFAHHTKVFGQRPFLWHISDGRKDGFSAIVSYHRLDNATLAKLTFTTLGGWIERQRAAADAGVAGADVRLAAAQGLQRRLQLILDGAPPYDVYVRWKSPAEQPIGWHPDLDDGVRLNIRPFVEAGVLRSKVNVHWKKDRGTNPDGTERHNDLHPTLDERRAARAAVGR